MLRTLHKYTGYLLPMGKRQDVVGVVVHVIIYIYACIGTMSTAYVYSIVIFQLLNCQSNAYPYCSPFRETIRPRTRIAIIATPYTKYFHTSGTTSHSPASVSGCTLVQDVTRQIFLRHLTCWISGVMPHQTTLVCATSHTSPRRGKRPTTHPGVLGVIRLTCAPTATS